MGRTTQRLLSRAKDCLLFPDRVWSDWVFRRRRDASPRGLREMPIFVVGTGRCGTTLLASMLDSHPRIAITPETQWFPGIRQKLLRIRDVDEMLRVLLNEPRAAECGLNADTIRREVIQRSSSAPSAVLTAFYETYAAVRGKVRWGDNSPSYGLLVPSLACFFGSCCYIHLIRDGRDVALSLLKRDWGPDTVEDAARFWKDRVLLIRENCRRQEHNLELRYEDLLTEPLATAKQICSFLGEDQPETLLIFREAGKRRLESMRIANAESRRESVAGIAADLDASKVAGWRSRMDERDQQAFLAIAGDLLEELGYPTS